MTAQSVRRISLFIKQTVSFGTESDNWIYEDYVVKSKEDRW